MKYFLIISGDQRSNDVRDWVDTWNKTVKRDDSPEIEFIYDPDYDDFDGVVVVGGDGKMLNAISDYNHKEKPFFGINRGTFGFLLNPIDSFYDFLEALKNFNQHKILELNLLNATFFGEADSAAAPDYAFNDVYVKAKEGNETIAGDVISYSSEKHFQKPFKGDGLIVATPQGSTAYNHSAGGYVLPLEEKLLAVTSICSMNEPIKEVTSIDKVDIVIRRGTAIGYADRKKIENVKKIVITPAHTVKLVFVKSYNYQLKRFQLK